jgi:hypothetical protein
LALIFAAALAAPATAQEGGFQPPVNGDGLPVPLNAPKPMPQAPMPREKADGRVQIELTFDRYNGAEFQWSTTDVPVMPQPRKPECCEPERCRQPAVAPVMPQPRRPAIIGYEVIEYSTTPLQSPPCPMGQPPVVRQFGTGCGSLAPQGCAPVPRVTYTRNHDIHYPAVPPAASQGCLPEALVTNERNFDIVVVPAASPAQLPPMHPGSFVVGVGGAACPAPACLPAPVRHQAWQPCPACPPPARHGPPDVTKQMAAETFGEMLLQSGVTPPPCPMPVPQRITVTAVTQARPGIVGAPIIGTWYRDLGAKRCVIAVEHDHMTITLSESREIEGNPVTAHITFTADYHLARDGSTAVGLITGVDMSFDGDVPEQETDTMMEAVAELRKAMEDKPFAMNCRLYGESLVIGKVRMPEWKDQREQPCSYIAGRYTSAAARPMPKQKVMKTPDAKAIGGAALPGGRYLDGHFPQYYAPDLALPLPRELVAQEGVMHPPAYIPAAGAVIGLPPRPTAGTPVGLPAGPASLGLQLGAPYQEPSPSGNLLPPPVPSTPAPGPVVRPYGEWVTPTPEVAPSMPEPTRPVPTMAPPAPLSLNVPPLGSSSLLRSLASASPASDQKQLFNFGTGLFGSQ